MRNLVNQTILKICLFLDLGMQSGLIPDESITASSWKEDFRPHTARFGNIHKGWTSSVSDYPQWLQVELNEDETLTHVATESFWVSSTISYCKSYTIHYRKASDAFVVYMENGHPRVSNDHDACN